MELRLVTVRVRVIGHHRFHNAGLRYDCSSGSVEGRMCGPHDERRLSNRWTVYMAINYWALASAFGGVLTIALMIWIGIAGRG